SPASGGCVFSNNSLPCSDGSLCTLQDYCSGGQCVPGQVLPCGDGNDCTSDTCHPVFGCKYVNVSGACNDGNPCTGPDLCTAGACQGTGLTNCADTISCTLDSCNPFLGCVHVSLDALCADDIPCTLNACGPLGCTLSLDHDACDDEVPCTQDTCDAVLGCLHVPTVDYLTDEDNCGGCGIHCQPGQTCTGGKCV
ncbi:MAG: hypothetical protein FJ098_10180, partial [Deltaproteobacteria bacterium]|nr:hypothetical protein [Deltaproteobacteria bacterium]